MIQLPDKHASAQSILKKMQENMKSIEETCIDFYVDSKSIRWDKDRLILNEKRIKGESAAVLTDIAFSQLCQAIGAPKNHLQKWPSDLREHVINRLFEISSIGSVFVRAVATEQGAKIRAILRSDFDPFDYTDLMSVLRSALDRTERTGGQATIERGTEAANLPDIYDSWSLRLIWPKTKMEIDTAEEAILHGIDISTSEVGLGTPSIESLLYQLVCTNGLKGIKGSQDTVRWRYCNTHHEQIIEKIVTYIRATKEKYYRKQEMLRKATTKRLSEIVAEKAFIKTLQKASAAGTVKQQEFFLSALKVNRKIGGGSPSYTLYGVISELTRIARDLYTGGERERSGRLERGAGELFSILDT